jgi:hypothetical protein
VPAATKLEEGASVNTTEGTDAKVLAAMLPSLPASAIADALVNAGGDAEEEAAATEQKKKAVREWTVDDVCTFFTELKLGEYIVAITENDVDGHTLLELLAVNALGELGIHSALHVIRIKRALKSIEDRAPCTGAQAVVRRLSTCCVALVQLCLSVHGSRHPRACGRTLLDAWCLAFVSICSPRVRRWASTIELACVHR